MLRLQFLDIKIDINIFKTKQKQFSAQTIFNLFPYLLTFIQM